MEGSEIVANLAEIKKDLQVGLINASNPENEKQAPVMGMDSIKPRLQLGSFVVKAFCRLKNHLQFTAVTKNSSESVKEALKHFTEVKDKEVEVYSTAFNAYGSEYLSPEWIEMLNKYGNSPLAPLVEFEFDKFNAMKAEVKLLSSMEKKEGEA